MSEVEVVPGDCLQIMQQMIAVDGGERFHACVTDPPYHLSSIVKRFGADNAAPAKSNGETGVYKRASAGFMGKKWDGGDIAFRPETWRLVYDLLKPGAHLCAFGAPRNYHRMACAIEDAGFEIRDSLLWLFGSGFPKSHDVSKAIDRAAGAKREKVRVTPRPETSGTMAGRSDTRPWIERSREIGYHEIDCPEPATAVAAAWQGWGTALKPAYEPIILARKPLVGTVAANVLKHGTGALNIDGCRIAVDGSRDWCAARRNAASDDARNTYGKGLAGSVAVDDTMMGRWPANICHDGSEEVLAAFPHAPGQQRRVGPEFGEKKSRGIYGDYGTLNEHEPRGDSGSAARFFYSAKADAGDRLGSRHPTVKPVDLMRWLVRLVTPPGGRVLDPFAGTGTTGMACMVEGFDCVLIEREAEYVADIRRRLAHVKGEDAPLFTGAAP